MAGSANLILGLVLDPSPTIGQIIAALLIGVFGYGLSITLWIAGARDLGAARGQLIFAIAPFVGAVIAWTILGEPVMAAQLVVLALALAGIGTVVRSTHLHEHRHTHPEHEHEHEHDDLHHDHGHVDEVDRHAHAHAHAHPELVHAHAHVPDLHHRHDHS